MNHLRTLHAVAIANAAELSTGALLARTCVSLPIQLVLRSMNIEFHQPATQAVVARCVSDPSTFALIPQVLDRDGKVGMKLQSEVFDISGNHVATGLFDWRILQNALEDETAIS